MEVVCTFKQPGFYIEIATICKSLAQGAGEAAGACRSPGRANSFPKLAKAAGGHRARRSYPHSAG
jgi:hypothetical protein